MHPSSPSRYGTLLQICTYLWSVANRHVVDVPYFRCWRTREASAITKCSATQQTGSRGALDTIGEYGRGWTASGMRVAVAGEFGHRDVSRKKVRNACCTSPLHRTLTVCPGRFLSTEDCGFEMRRHRMEIKLTLIALWCYSMCAVENRRARMT